MHPDWKKKIVIGSMATVLNIGGVAAASDEAAQEDVPEDEPANTDEQKAAQ